jgi:superfamily I DNA/RNA helicase
MLGKLATHFTATSIRPYDFLVVDEAQDIGIAQLRFVSAIRGQNANSLFFTGDLGQRIFQQPFSWRSVGVDVRGRSRSLRVNYRTSHQIRSTADCLLGPEISDVDGITEDRRGTVSVFNGPPPRIEIAQSLKQEASTVSSWLTERQNEGILPHEMAVFVRSSAQITRARDAVQIAGIPHKIIDESIETSSGYLSLGTMHLAKGLEFRAVVVMACDDEVVPLQSRIEGVMDDSDLEEVYNTERHLLYVACTRARDNLLVTGVAPGSEFLDDLRSNL